MIKTALLAVVALVAAMLVTSPAPALAAASARGNGIRLQANLTGKTAVSGKADYRETTKNGQTVRRISVEVEDAPPGSIWAVRLNGKVIGQVKVNNLGTGDFNRQSITDDPGKQGPVPAMKAGDKITVGPGVVSGILKNT